MDPALVASPFILGRLSSSVELGRRSSQLSTMLARSALRLRQPCSSRSMSTNPYMRTPESAQKVMDTFKKYRACAVLRTPKENQCAPAMQVGAAAPPSAAVAKHRAPHLITRAGGDRWRLRHRGVHADDAWLPRPRVRFPGQVRRQGDDRVRHGDGHPGRQGGDGRRLRVPRRARARARGRDLGGAQQHCDHPGLPDAQRGVRGVQGGRTDPEDLPGRGGRLGLGQGRLGGASDAQGAPPAREIQPPRLLRPLPTGS